MGHLLFNKDNEKGTRKRFAPRCLFVLVKSEWKYAKPD